MKNYPEIETNRLKLGSISHNDIPKIIEFAGNAKIAETTLNMPHPYQEKDAIFWINMANQGYENKSQYIFAIRLKSTNEFIGGIDIAVNSRFNSGELGYWIAEPFWNNGFATEAVGRMLRFGFENLDLNKIFALHLVDNPASGKVMINNGMIKEGDLKDHIKKDDTYRSLYQYRLTKSEFQNL